MEKKIFNTDLGSLVGQEPIEVDGVDNYGMSDYTPESFQTKKDEEPKDKQTDKKKEDILIDLDDTKKKVETEPDEEEIEEDLELEDEKDPKEDQPSSKKTEKQSSSPFTPYAKLLKDEGILPNLDLKEFDGTAEGLKEAMINEIIGGVEYYKEMLPPRIKTLIDHYEDGVPLERLLELDKHEVELQSVDEAELKEDVELQKQTMVRYYKRTTKFNDQKINKQIQFLEDSGDLEDEAVSANKELKGLLEDEKKEASANAQKEREAAQRRIQNELKELEGKIKATDEIVPGVKLSKNDKVNLYKSLTTAAGVDKNGNPVNKLVAARMEDPYEFEIRLHYLFELTKGFKDFSKLSDKGKKDGMKEFESAIQTLDKNDSVSSSGSAIDTKAKNRFLSAINKQFNIE